MQRGRTLVVERPAHTGLDPGSDFHRYPLQVRRRLIALVVAGRCAAQRWTPVLALACLPPALRVGGATEAWLLTSAAEFTSHRSWSSPSVSMAGLSKCTRQGRARCCDRLLQSPHDLVPEKRQRVIGIGLELRSKFPIRRGHSFFHFGARDQSRPHASQPRARAELLSDWEVPKEFGIVPGLAASGRASW